jgi:sugar transferase (PEP-CTERM system associated)
MCVVAAIYMRFQSDATDILISRGGWLKLLYPIAVVQGSFYLFDLYDLRLIRQRATLFIRIIQAIGLAAISLAVIFYLSPQMMLGRGVYLISLLLVLTVMTCWRVFVMWLLGHPRLAERVLILGTEESAVEIAREVLDRSEEGYKIIGFVGDDPKLVGQSLINPCVLGLSSELEELVRLHKADRIVIAMSDLRGHLPVNPLLKMRLRDGIAIEESSSFYERLTGKISIDMLRPSRLVFSNNTRRTRLYKHGRRAVEVLAALIGLALSLPLMVLVAIAIKLDSRGPILYRQRRVGAHNGVFEIIKFRSMHIDAKADERRSRTTRVGRLIRRLRIDELPQLINIFRNEMSFIGPRPERPVFVSRLEREIPYYSQRHLLKPGLTGWAQIRFSPSSSIEDAAERLQYDLYYIKNQSLVLDAIIVFETVRIALFGRGAR